MRGAIAIVIAIAASACGPSDAARSDASAPRVVRDADATARNAGCVSCHRETAERWRESLHARAFTDAGFAAAFASEPEPFCQGCHAPESVPTDPQDPDAAIGVACITCHASIDMGTAGGHATPRAPIGDQVCAACHEFGFPDGGGAMQTTVTEHAQSPFAARSCIDCHMPSEAGHRDHGFHASRDPTLLRSAIAIEAHRDGPERVVVHLRLGEVGHAFPTGDMFRRVVVYGQAVDAHGVAVAADAVVFDRGLLDEGDRVDASAAFDVRLGAPGRPREQSVTLELPGAAAWPVKWSVAYQRIEPIGHDEDEALLAEIELGGGTLLPTKLR